MKSNLSTIIFALPLLLLASGNEEIDKAIAQAPALMLSQTDDVGTFIRQTCDKIAKLPDTQARYSCFRKLMESACKVKLENVEDMVPMQPIEMPEVEEFRREHLRKVLQDRASRFREMKIASIRGSALERLRLMADQISGRLLLEQPTPAPGVELLEPYFKLIEKLKTEERKGWDESSDCECMIDQVERIFNFTHLKVMGVAGGKPDPQDRAAVEARFREVVGRPIRSAEQYKTDARRRTEANIREHRKQEEENRRAVEYQKRFKKEHNVRVE